jgi:3'-phosphoadenosine 5'-phosphosulfate sulfotransferase (PAPS reductase)/FAD synthetase
MEAFVPISSLVRRPSEAPPANGPDLKSFHAILVSSSAGKDSQAMLDYVVELADAAGVSRETIAVVHADLGRVEWAGTRELAERQAKHYGLRFLVVKRPQGDLLDHIEKRGMWPSSTTRYCTSDHKRAQIQKVITQLHREWKAAGNSGTFKLLQCMGLRAEESPARAKKVPFELNPRASSKSREVWNWLPIHGWTEAQVWARIKVSGVPHHPAYDLGMPRLSCVFCIFAPRKALVLAGTHNRELLDTYAALEKKMDHTFRQDVTMAEIKAAVEAGESVEATEMTGCWNM